MKKIITMLTTILMLVTLAGCASTGTSESTGQYLDSTAITTKVKAKIASDLGVSTLKSISVTTYKGVVQLSGFVKNQNIISKATKIAQSVSGVKQVENSLLVRGNMP